MTGGAASGDDHDLSVRVARARREKAVGRKGSFSERKEHKGKHRARRVAVWRLCVINRMRRTG